MSEGEGGPTRVFGQGTVIVLGLLFLFIWALTGSFFGAMVVTAVIYFQWDKVVAGFRKNAARDDLSARMSRYFSPDDQADGADAKTADPDVPANVMARPAEAPRMDGTRATSFSSAPTPRRKPVDLPRHR